MYLIMKYFEQSTLHFNLSTASQAQQGANNPAKHHWSHEITHSTSFYFNVCTLHLLILYFDQQMYTIISQIITLLHVSTLSCHLQRACNQYLAKLHKCFKCSCWLSSVELWWHTVTYVGEVTGELSNGIGSQYPSHYLGTWCIQHYCVSSITTADAHTSAASSRLRWRPRRFKWTRPFHRKTKIWFLSACAYHISTGL